MMNWKRALLAIWGASLVPIYVISFMAPASGLFHDDGIYVVTAKALAEGKGYRIVSLPEEIPQTKYPPLFPLLLAAIWRVNPAFPGNASWLKMVPLAAALTWLWLSYVLLRRESGSKWVAAVLTLIAASSPWTVYLSTTLLSETLFAALATGCLLLLRRCEEEPENNWCLFWSAVLASGAFLTRTIGVCVVLAGILALFGRRRFRHGLVFLAYSAATTAPWLIWVVFQRASKSVGTGYYTLENYTNWNVVLNYNWPQKASILVINALRLLLSLAWPLGFASPPPLWTLLVLGMLLLFGLRVYAQKQAKAPLLYFVLYVVMVLAWAWPSERFLAVVYPLTLLVMWWPLALLLKTNFLRPLKSRWVIPMGGVICLAVSAVWQLPGISIATWRSGHMSPGRVRTTPRVAYDWGDFTSITAWVRARTPQSAVLMGNIDPLLFLYTSRKAVRPFQADAFALFYADRETAKPLGSPCDFGSRLRSSGTTYLVVTPTGDYAEEPFLERLQQDFGHSFPGVLSRAYEGSNPAFAVYSVDRGMLSRNGALAACR